MAAGWFNPGIALTMQAGVDFGLDDIRCLLTTSAYTPDLDAHDFVADVTNELSGGNYVRKALANESVDEDDANDRVDFSADNVTWTALEAAAGTPARAVLFLFVTNDADSPLLGYVDLTTPPTPNGTDYTVKWNGGASSGTILRATRA